MNSKQAKRLRKMVLSDEDVAPLRKQMQHRVTRGTVYRNTTGYDDIWVPKQTTNLARTWYTPGPDGVPIKLEKILRRHLTPKCPRRILKLLKAGFKRTHRSERYGYARTA